MGNTERQSQRPDGGASPLSADERRILGIDRRGFLGGAAALLGAAALESIAHETVYRNAKAVLSGPLLEATSGLKPSFSIDIHRREDFLLLRADGYNLIRSGQRLVAKKSAEPARLVITFVPQHVAEQAFAEGAPASYVGDVHALAAAPSRLAFFVPGQGIPLTIDGLLSWIGLSPSLAPAAAQAASASSSVRRPAAHAHAVDHRDGSHHRHRRRHRHHRKSRQHRHGAQTPAPDLGAALKEPSADQTAIELPWHLALSPTADGRWVNEAEPITLGGGTEIWRASLVTPEGPAQVPGGAVRAVWNYDTTGDTPTLGYAAPPTDPGAFTSSLNPTDRWEIVKASADFTVQGRADIAASQLLLSARGGSLTARASWNAPQLQISEWSHEATQGRDQYVKVANKGFLFPFGHAVSLVTVTQREFDEVEAATVGFMRQTVHLVVTGSVVSHDPASNPAVAYTGLDFPFRSVELTDTGTPTLDPISPFVNDGNDPRNTSNPPPFVPTVNNAPVTWHFVGTDWSGRTVGFAAQAVFVSYDDAMDADRSSIVRAQYNSLPSSSELRTTDFGGAVITFAESYAEGDTDLSTHGMTFAGSPGRYLGYTDHVSAGVPYFLPTLLPRINGEDTGAQVSVSLAAVEQAAGAPLGGSLPTAAYYPGFVENGFYSAQSAVNQGNVFMEMLGDANSLPSLTFNPKAAGGVLTPNLQLQGLSRSLGPVGDLENIYQGSFKPSTIFAALDGPNAARILGGVKLSDILEDANLLDGASADVPNPQGLKVTATRQGEVATTVIQYSPKLATNPLNGAPQIITPRSDAATHPLAFNLTCTITTDALAPQNSKYSIHGELDNFIVNLVSTGDDQFISIVFNKFSFDSVSGGKPKLGVKIDSVNFDGALKFVEQLAAFMNLDGAGGPSITDLVDGISSDLSLKLPSIEVGILSLAHIAIDTGFQLPFDGSASLFNFGFASPGDPFTLALGIFGGGGFLSLSLGTVGVKDISGSFEFGAMAALDLGVASGSVSLTAGFYFKYDVDTTKVDLTKVPPPTPPTTCVLSGFVKLTGHLSVLEIVTLALEFDLTLTYLDPPGSLTGTATLVVSVSLLFFHKSVTLTATKTFVNGSSSSHAAPAGKRRATLNAPQSFGDQMTQSDWNTYCQAFAPVS